MLLAVIFVNACTRGDPKLTPALQELARQQDLAIIMLFNSPVEEARTLDLKVAGRLKLPEPPAVQEISPDGTCLAWLNSFPPANGAPGEPVAFTMDTPGSVHRVEFSPGGAYSIAPSARCERLALRTQGPNYSLRLIVIDVASGGRVNETSQIRSRRSH